MKNQKKQIIHKKSIDNSPVQPLNFEVYEYSEVVHHEN